MVGKATSERTLRGNARMCSRFPGEEEASSQAARSFTTVNGDSYHGIST